MSYSGWYMYMEGEAISKRLREGRKKWEKIFLSK